MTSTLWIFALGLVIVSALMWMLISINIKSPVPTVKQGVRKAPCPICGHMLEKGERVRSSVTEIGNVEVQTRIKGCPYCLGKDPGNPRICPVCRKNLTNEMTVLAVSDPRVDKRKLLIRGCPQCYPQGFPA